MYEHTEDVYKYNAILTDKSVRLNFESYNTLLHSCNRLHPFYTAALQKKPFHLYEN